MRLTVAVTPNARRTEVLGVFDDALKIKLQAQPIEGKANEALVKFLAGALSVSRGSVVITQGLTNRRKVVEVTSGTLTVEVVERTLGV